MSRSTTIVESAEAANSREQSGHTERTSNTLRAGAIRVATHRVAGADPSAWNAAKRMEALERADVDSQVAVAHVHDEESVPMARWYARGAREPGSRAVSGANRSAYFKCPHCGTLVAIHLSRPKR